MKRRLSLQKIEILSCLQDESLQTVTKLVNHLGVLQPSISRSLRILKVEGLVEYYKNGWRLTDKGRVISNHAEELIIFEVTKIVNSLTKIQRMLNKGIDLNRVKLSLDPVFYLIHLLCLFIESQEVEK